MCKNRLRELLREGRSLCSQRYFEHCVRHHVKTFYFFCERLSSDRTGAAQSSTALNVHILTQLRDHAIDVNNQFNPEAGLARRGRTCAILPRTNHISTASISTC